MTSRVQLLFVELSTLHKKVTSTIRLPLELTAAISSKAKLQGTSMQAIVERYLEAWVQGDVPAQNTPYAVPPPPPPGDSHGDEELITSFARIQDNDPAAAAAIRLLVNRIEYRSRPHSEQPIDVGAAAAEGERLAETILGGLAGSDQSPAEDSRRTGVSSGSTGKVSSKAGDRKLFLKKAKP